MRSVLSCVIQRTTASDLLFGLTSSFSPFSSAWTDLFAKTVSNSKGFGKTAGRPPQLCYSTCVTLICIEDNKCLLFINKNKMEMITRKPTFSCSSSNFQHPPPFRNTWRVLSRSVQSFAFNKTAKSCQGSWWHFDLALSCFPCSSFLLDFSLFHFEALLLCSWNRINTWRASACLYLMQL